MTTDTAETYIATPGSPLAAATPKPPRTFQGKPLFAYSEGVRLLYPDLMPNTADAGVYLVGLVYALTDLQTSFDAYKKREASDEAAEEGAYATLLEISGSGPAAFHANVIARAGKLSRPELKEAVKLGESILRQYDAENPDEEETALEPSEVHPALFAPEKKKRSPAGQRGGKATAKARGAR